MGRKEITTKEDLMKVIELFENTGITYWLDGGWGVDILVFLMLLYGMISK